MGKMFCEQNACHFSLQRLLQTFPYKQSHGYSQDSPSTRTQKVQVDHTVIPFLT